MGGGTVALIQVILNRSTGSDSKIEMSNEKPKESAKKTRLEAQAEALHRWCREIRKQIKLPENLEGTLIGMVDATHKSKLTVHIYKVGPKAGNLIVQKQTDIVPEFKFWIVGAPKSGADGECPSFQLLLKRKQDVSVYTGNHYITTTVTIDPKHQLSKLEKLKLFARKTKPSSQAKVAE